MIQAFYLYLMLDGHYGERVFGVCVITDYCNMKHVVIQRVTNLQPRDVR